MSTEHEDEGTIHAWLDDALDAAAAARVAAHVAACADCSAAAAEARGLIAGASRVVRALDPAAMASSTAGPAWGAPATSTPAAPTATGGSLWRALRVTPARAAIAATILVAAGITLTWDYVAKESARAPAERADTTAFAAATPTPAPAAAPAAALAAPHRDPLLDSAVRRNIAQALPPRAVERAPGPDVLAARPAPSSPATANAAAPLEVAAGRAAAQAARETTAAPVDHPLAADAVAGLSRRVAVAKDVAPPAAEAPAARARGDVGTARTDSAATATALAGQCLRVESATPGATWGSVPLPFVLALGDASGGRGGARVIGPSPEASAQALWRPAGPDSVHLDLRRIGYTGTMELALAGGVSTGTMRSAESVSRLESMVVTGAEPTAKPRVTRKRATPATTVPVVSAPIDVTARRVKCP